MTREQAKLFINENPGKYFELAKNGKSYICPICGSGSGKNGSGITTQDKIHYTCWAGCFSNSDIIDIIGMEQNITDYNSKLRAAADIYGIDIDGNFEHQNYTKSERIKAPAKAPAKAEAEAEPQADYTAFYLEANKNLSKTDYYLKRGISQATADQFNLGYVEAWKHPKAPTAPATPRLIIPTSSSSYIARDTRAEIPEEQNGFKKQKAGKAHIFNLEAIRTATKPVIITEGEIDAMSIYEAGGIAVGLGGTSGAKQFIQIATTEQQIQPYIIALDNDDAGRTNSKRLTEKLQAANVYCLELNIQGKYKDANEALQADRQSLINRVKNAEALIMEFYNDEEQKNRIEYEQRNQAGSYLEKMRQELESDAEQAEISTGFKGIDKIINGGLYPGLYFIGAISSLGKTTLALQMADAVAKQGNDALIISLEMAKKELIAKSISRLTAEYSKQTAGTVTKLGRSTADIMNIKRQRGFYNEQGAWVEYDEKIKAEIAATVDKAYKRYSDYAQHIFIYEGIGDITPEKIQDRVREHSEIYGRAPVVIIDYLQIIQGDNERDTDKTKTDKNVVALKRLSRDYKIPVIAISSVNRDSYSKPINMESFKESGGIEFSSDILIGLQYKGMDYEPGESDKDRLGRISDILKDMREKASQGEPQPIQVKILKNRNGSRGTAELSFYPMYNYFTESNAGPAAKQPKTRQSTIL